MAGDFLHTDRADFGLKGGKPTPDYGTITEPIVRNGATMRPTQFSADTVVALLREQTVAALPDVMAALGPRVSKRTAFRKVKDLNARTSYSHRGGYYTLDELADFDEHGLWAFADVRFSRAGTLIATAEAFVNDAEAGHFVDELDNRSFPCRGMVISAPGSCLNSAWYQNVHRGLRAIRPVTAYAPTSATSPAHHHSPSRRHQRLPAPSQIAMCTRLISAPSRHQVPMSTFPDPKRMGAAAVP